MLWYGLGSIIAISSTIQGLFRYSGYASHFLFHARYDYVNHLRNGTASAQVHQLTASLYVRAGALTSHDLNQNWWLWKELVGWFSCYLWCADIELLKSKSREFPRCVLWRASFYDSKEISDLSSLLPLHSPFLYSSLLGDTRQFITCWTSLICRGFNKNKTL